MYIKPFKFIEKLFPSFIWSFPDETEGVFLTFDDGPNPDVTPWVLETLKKYDAKATFFCLGKNAEQYPEVYQKILDAGHAVGNHSYSHIKGWGTEVGTYIGDFNFAETFIDSNLVRPPYGRVTPTQARMLRERFNIIMWTILSRDYSRTISRRGCVRNVTKHVHPGAIIVFHDSKKAEKNLRYALPRVLEYLKEHNLKCKKIEL